MALRLANKINRQIVKNAYRSLSAKREPELEKVVQKVEEVTKTDDVPPSNLPLNGTTIPAQYEVCRPRTTPITPFPHAVQNETDVAKKTVALQHLQPSMLPEYYKPPIEINAACMYFDPITETDRQATSKYRQFEQSKTCKNVTLPLRGPKLASPFPDPVKVMQSHTISDQEKAEQMLADSKMVKGNVDNSKHNRHPSIRSIPSTRTYSTNHPGCKKKKVEGKKVCPRVRVPGCRPIKSIKCGKVKKERPTCMKKPPPYPSYSETCHEDPHNKPSECKTCPYKPDDHPHFTPPKQDFHTCTANFTKQKDECTKPPSHDKKPCGWEKQKKPKGSTTKPKPKKPHPKKKAMINISDNLFLQKIAQPEQSLELKLKSKIFPFSAPKTTEYKEEKKAQARESNAISSEVKQTSNVSLRNEMGTWINRLQPEDVLLPVGELHVADPDHEEKGKCRKFPFKECTFTIVKERKERPVYQKCPPKPKRKLTKDCPPDRDDDRCKRTSSMNDVSVYLTSNESNNDKAKKKCPRVNLGVCKDPNEHVDDPCRRKRRGKTLICPDDLLNRKPKPKKKTSPLIPLAQMSGASKSNTVIKI